MKKSVVIAMLVAVLLLGGAMAYFIMEGDDGGEQANSQDASNSESVDDIASPDAQVFEPIATTSQSFIVTLEAMGEDAAYSGTVSFDGSGNTLFEGTFQDDELKFYDVDGRFISCQNDTCYELPDGQNGVDSNSFTYDDSKLNEYKQDAEYIGTADCPAGMCSVWQVVKDDVDVMIYVAADGRISKAEGTSSGSEFSAIFTYQPVTITAPENVAEYPL